MKKFFIGEVSMLKRQVLFARCVGLSLLLVSPSATAEDKPGTQSADVVESKDKATVAKDKPGTPAIKIEVKSIEYVVVSGVTKKHSFDWEVSTNAIESVLKIVSAQLLPYFQGHSSVRIIISHYDEYPITLNNRAPGGEYQIWLATSGKQWPQYAHQFAHELGHVLSSPVIPNDRLHGKNQWFAEAICDTASLFVLSKMIDAWDANPPLDIPKTAEENAFKHYRNNRLANLSRRLPPDQTMPQWIKNKLPDLRGQDEITDQSRLVAAYLFPIFRDSPEGWAAITSLPGDEGDIDLDFEQYLEVWRSRASDDKSKQLIGKIQALFGYQSRPSESEASTTKVQPQAPGTPPEQPSLPSDHP